MNLAEWRRKRPNKLAAGMNYTAQRQRRPIKRIELVDEINTLCVRGTLDKLGAGLLFCRVHSVCQCCGSKTGPYVLTDRGRAKLRKKRRQ